MFSLKIETDNDAFSGNPREELARILHEVADSIEAGSETFTVRDYNGNKVGKAVIDIEEESEETEEQESGDNDNY